MKKSDIMILFGSHDLKTAMYGADLYHKGLCQKIICSGGLGRNTAGLWTESEASKYKEIPFSKEFITATQAYDGLHGTSYFSVLKL